MVGCSPSQPGWRFRRTSQQEAWVELVGSVVGTNPTLAPLPKGEDDREQVPAGVGQAVAAGAIGNCTLDDPGSLQFLEPLGKQRR